MIRLKRTKRDQDYALDECAASRCASPSSVIDDTRNRWPAAVPLCDRHYAEACTDNDKEGPDASPAQA